MANSGNEYVSVEAATAPLNDSTIPSGATQVLNFYFSWDRNTGFTETGKWFAESKGTPIYESFGGEITEADFANAMKNNHYTNLNDIFLRWQTYISTQEALYPGTATGWRIVDDFVTQILKAGGAGCVTYPSVGA